MTKNLYNITPNKADHALYCIKYLPVVAVIKSSITTHQLATCLIFLMWFSIFWNFWLDYVLDSCCWATVTVLKTRAWLYQ